MSLSLPGGSAGIKYKKPECREKLVRSYEPVLLKNASDLTLRWKYRGDNNQEEAYELPPKTQMRVPMRIAWYVLGDPDRRPGQQRKPMFGCDLDWSKEVERLMHMWGAWVHDPMKANGPNQLPGGSVYDRSSIFHAIKTGLVWCREIAEEFGKGETYYSCTAAVAPPKYVAHSPLTLDDEVNHQSNHRPAAVSKVVAHAMVDDDEMVAVPKSSVVYVP